MSPAKITFYDAEIIDAIRRNHGIRRLSVDNSWEKIDIITYPEKAVFEFGLLAVAKRMVPHLPCSNRTELMEMAFFKENLKKTDAAGNNAAHRLLMQPEVNIQLVQFLIDKGIDVKTKNAAGKTVIDCIFDRDLAEEINISLHDRIEEFRGVTLK